MLGDGLEKHSIGPEHRLLNNSFLFVRELWEYFFFRSIYLYKGQFGRKKMTETEKIAKHNGWALLGSNGSKFVSSVVILPYLVTTK